MSPAHGLRSRHAALPPPAGGALLAGALLAGALLAGCATADPPPGGEEDRTPPVVVAVTPEPGSVLADLRQPAEFRFDERISERGVGASVLVSPRTGVFLVDRGGREIRVRQAGGWSPGVVYRVTLLPGVSDLFGNARTQAAELVFSTGPEIPPTVLGGVVTDRMTGEPVAGAAVTAVPAGDTIPYVAIADPEGFFAIRFLPPGSYLLHGIRDSDGDWRVGPFEPSDARLVDVAAGDTLVEPLALLAPDTTPPALMRAEYVDSVTVRLTFDDALAPEDPQEGLAVRVVGTADGHEPAATPIAPHLLEAALAEDFASDTAGAAAGGPDGAAGDAGADPEGAGEDADDEADAAGEAAEADRLLGAAVDSLAPPEPDTVRSLDGPAGAAAPAAPAPPEIDVPRGPDGTPLPTREWYARLDAPLRAGVTYLVFVTGARNVNGLAPGGGEAEFTAPEPEPAEAEGDPPAGEDPPADGEDPPAAGEDPLTDGEDPPAAGEDPLTDGEDPPAGDGAPPPGA